MPFHAIEHCRAVIEIDAGTHTASRVTLREFHNRALGPLQRTAQNEPQSLLDQRRESHAPASRFMPSALEERPIETDSRAHITEHMHCMSVCQCGAMVRGRRGALHGRDRQECRHLDSRYATPPRKAGRTRARGRGRGRTPRSAPALVRATEAFAAAMKASSPGVAIRFDLHPSR